MEKTKTIFVVLLFIVVSIYCKDNLFSQNRPLTNYEAIGKISSSIHERIIKEIPENVVGVDLNIEGDTNKWVFQNLLVEKLRNKYISSIGRNEQEKFSIDIHTETKIRYSSCQDDEKFVREIVSLCLISYNNEKNQKNYSENYCDTLKIDDLQFINNKKIIVSSNSIDEGSIFDTLLKPLVILSSSGVLVYLLFTVRSK